MRGFQPCRHVEEVTDGKEAKHLFLRKIERMKQGNAVLHVRWDSHGKTQCQREIKDLLAQFFMF